MICQLRFLGLLWELLWVKGLLIGFSLPEQQVPYFGLNFGPLALMISKEPFPADCDICGTPNTRGLHGTFWGRKLCRGPRIPLCRECSDSVWDAETGLCLKHFMAFVEDKNFRRRQHCPYK